MNNAARVAEHAARASYGRLLAVLAARSSDIASAEDALSEAFAKALTLWPKDGVPDNPDGWLMRVARNQLIDLQRRAARLAPEEEVPEVSGVSNEDGFPDRRLQMMLVCAHPAIDPKMHTPLMLQCVMGLDAQQIGHAFLVPKATMAQRLVRAKTKIKANAVPFVVPEKDAFASRLGAVLEAIYTAYSIDWLEFGEDLGMEALFLADVLTTLLPENAEVLGIAALLGFAAARRDARIQENAFVPLDEQDPQLWNKDLLRGAQATLRKASDLEQFGRFQLEAAIHSVHAQRIDGVQVDWRAITQLYSGLTQLYPTLGGQIGHAIALSHVNGAKAGLAVLSALDTTSVAGLQSYHAAHAHLLAQGGELTAAITAYDKALALTPHRALRAFLKTRRQAIVAGL